jgi:hypothetical protein
VSVLHPVILSWKEVCVRGTLSVGVAARRRLSLRTATVLISHIATGILYQHNTRAHTHTHSLTFSLSCLFVTRSLSLSLSLVSTACNSPDNTTQEPLNPINSLTTHKHAHTEEHPHLTSPLYLSRSLALSDIPITSSESTETGDKVVCACVGVNACAERVVDPKLLRPDGYMNPRWVSRSMSSNCTTSISHSENSCCTTRSRSITH